MVEIAPPSSSFNARKTPRQRPNGEASNKKPIWLFACYALFALACLNLVKTYTDLNESARLRIEQEESEKVDNVDNVGYSAGAEENVVSAGVGSSQYGMSVKASQPGKKKKKLPGTTFNDIRPKPSDGSKDYIIDHSPSDFKGFSF